jgi:hypothetical protein
VYSQRAKAYLQVKSAHHTSRQAEKECLPAGGVKNPDVIALMDSRDLWRGKAGEIRQTQDL